MEQGRKLSVLLVPDTIFWVTGTMANSIRNFVPGIDARICSGAVVRKIIKEYPEWLAQFDLVHVICPYASDYLIPYFKTRTPLVTTVHHVVEWQRMEHNRYGDAVMTIAKEWKAFLLERGVSKDKLFLVPNGVDTTLFSPATDRDRALARQEAGFKPDDFVVGFFAKRQRSNFDRKGIDVFEKAIALLEDRITNLAFLLVGPGWESLSRELTSRSVRHTWISYVDPHERLREMYHALDCYWITSRMEGGPVTLLEAMSCGLPCVTTPVGLAAEAVQDGKNGFLVDIGNAEGFAEATSRIAAGGELIKKINQMARTTILSSYDYKITLRDIPLLYDTAARNFRERVGSPVNSVATRALVSEAWIEKQEYLTWIAILRNVGESRHAFRFAWKTWVRWPFSSEAIILLLKTSYKLVF